MKIGTKITISFFTALMFLVKVCNSKDTALVENKAKLYLCLNTCAMCVEHWEPGLYNGPRCAKQCMKHKGQKIVDPDCIKLKMFNYDPEVLKEHRKFLRQQSEQVSEED